MVYDIYHETMIRIFRVVVLFCRRSNEVNDIGKDDERDVVTDAENVVHNTILDKQNRDVQKQKQKIGFRELLNHQQLHQRRLGVGEGKLRRDLQFLHRKRLNNEEFYPVTE